MARTMSTLVAVVVGALSLAAGSGGAGAVEPLPGPAPSAAQPLATGSISGTLTVPAGLDPTQVAVQVYPEHDYSATAAMVSPAPDGRYTADGIPPGRYRVEFQGWAAGTVHEFFNDSPFFEQASIVTVGTGPVTGIDATLQRGAVLSGRVHADSAFDLSRIRIDLTGPAGHHIPTGAVQADGTWSVRGLPAGSYWIRFDGRAAGLPQVYWSSTGAQAGPPLSRVPVADGGTVTGLDVHLTGPVGSLSGRVTAPPGVDPTQVVVRATGVGQATARVNADGTYRFDRLPVGWYVIAFLANDLVLEYWRDGRFYSDAAGVLVYADQATTGIDADVAAVTITALTSSSPAAHVGDPVTFHVRVASVHGAPPGQVELLGPAGSLGTVQLSAGSADVEVAGLPLGRHTITARYLGSGLFGTSSGSATQWVSTPTVPRVSRVEPATGVTTGGSTVRLFGDGFTGATAVSFDGSPGWDLKVVSPTELVVTAPAHAAGRVPVAVATPTGTSAPAPAARFSFAEVVAQTPVRFGPWPQPPGSVQCSQVAGAPGVPAGATGAIVNLTVVRPGGVGYAVVYPDVAGTGATPPPAGSTVNFEPGRDVANSAFVALPPNGRACVATLGARVTSVIMDVSGFTLDRSGIVTQASRRLLDTRASSHVGEVTGPVTPRHVYTVQVAGVAGVPADASAALLNVTVTGATTVGHLRVFPGGQGVPTTSVVNFAPGQDKANATLVPLTDGTISFYSDSPAPTSTSPVQVILDVVGHVEAGGAVVGVAPVRIADTRTVGHVGPISGPLVARQVYSLQVAGSASVPADATAVVLNVTAVGPSDTGNLSVYPDSDGTGLTAPPGTSTLNYIPGRDIPNQVVVALPSNGRVAFYSDMFPGGTVHLAVDVVGYLTTASRG